MTKIHLGIFIIGSALAGYWLGISSISSEPMIIERKTKTHEIQECRAEVEELKSQCSDKASELVAKSTNPENFAEASLDSGSWLKLGRRSLEIAFEADVKDFLKQVEVPNLFDELKRAKSVGDDQLKVLNGKFLGQVIFEDKGKEDWEVQLSLSGAITDGEAKGDKFIELSKNGKVFSRTTGRGRIKNVYTMESDANVILAEVNGDEGYMQIYYLPRLDIFTGNYYNKTGVGKFEREGTVTLKRL